MRLSNILYRSAQDQPEQVHLQSSLQPTLLALNAHRILRLAAKKVPPILERPRAFLNIISTNLFHLKESQTYHTAKTPHMPLRPQRLNHRIRNRLPTLLTLGTIPMRMTIHTPRIPILFHKRRARIKRIATLRAEKVSCMPLGAARDNDFAFNGRLARFAPRREEFVEVEVAEEALGFVGAVFVFEARHVVGRGVCGKEGDVFTALAGADPGNALGQLVVGFGVEGDTFEVFAALVAGEAFGVEAGAGC